jgi:chromosome transmission fidelity protein 1
VTSRHEHPSNAVVNHHGSQSRHWRLSSPRCALVRETSRKPVAREKRLATHAVVSNTRAATRIAPRQWPAALPLGLGKAPHGDATAVGRDGDFDLADWEGQGVEHRKPGQSSVVLDVSDDSGADSESDDGASSGPRPWRVLYCSRTHSQLAQVVGEVRKTTFGEHISVVSLAGRKQLCVNDDVRSLASTERVNEACLDLQTKAKKGTEPGDGQGKNNGGVRNTGGPRGKRIKGGGRCPFHKASDEEQLRSRQAVADRILVEPLDVEEIASLGRREGCCAYYATRGALSDAQLILLPYASLLHAGTRESLGISLHRSVVIVDEAHNLLDTINDTHSVTLTARQLSEVSAQLAQYAERYHARLKPPNRLCVQQLLHVIRQLRAALLTAVAGGGREGSAMCKEKIVRMNSFLCSLNIDHLNLYRLQAFCDGSQIAKKLRGFTDAQAQASRADAHSEAARGSLHGVIRVLEALTNVDADARVLVHIERRESASEQVEGDGPKAASGMVDASWLRVLHLNPAVHFSRVLSEAHSIVLAGGTMQPFADLEQQIFHSLPPGRLRTCSFGHIVPPANLMPVVLSKGANGVPMQFTFASRAEPRLMDELGRALLALCADVPDGVVVFVPSFGYEEQLVAHFKKNGSWRQMGALKKLFREPRESADLDRVLKAYSATIDANFAASPTGDGGTDGGPRGALLLSVVGGKMSEGINFADGLGRCVVMVGMPFANPSELTLQERMAHLDQMQGEGSGREYYTNLCMKAVNQSIGRAIRHIGDYATIVLVDARFAKGAVRRRLPTWIGDQLRTPDTFDEVAAAVRGFFASRASEQLATEERRRGLLHMGADVP